MNLNTDKQYENTLTSDLDAGSSVGGAADDAASGHTPSAPVQVPALLQMRHDLRTPLNAIIGYCEMLQEDYEIAADKDSTGSDTDGDFRHGLHTIRDAANTLQNLMGEILGPTEEEEAEPDLRAIGLRFQKAAAAPLRIILETSFLLLQIGCRSSSRTQQESVAELGKIRAAAQKLSDFTHEFANLSPVEFHSMAELAASAREEQPAASGKDTFGKAASGKDTPTDATPANVTPTEGAPNDAASRHDWVEVAHLLVVDDNAENREMLMRRLQKRGYTVVTASNGIEALNLVREQAFDLILLDIMMPEMDGMEVLRHLKSQSTLRHIPVVVISALDDIDSVARCIELGAEDYLPKPFNPVLLRARVSAGLEKKRLRDREIHLYEQLQENYNKLQEVEALRDSLIHMVVHDMRTPLTSVLTGLSTLEAAGSLNEIQQECLRIGQGSGQSLLMMINDLLDINQMEENALELQCEAVPVQEVVTAALDKVQTLAERRQQSISTTVAPGLPPVQADRIKLERILTNLLGNAIKFTGAGGTISLCARLDDDEKSILFSVTDTGEGIPPEALDKIFDKFGQVRTDRTRRTLSTGLGLTFCKLAVEAHNGHIWVESEPGKGSTFSFTIPL